MHKLKQLKKLEIDYSKRVTVHEKSLIHCLKTLNYTKNLKLQLNDIHKIKLTS